MNIRILKLTLVFQLVFLGCMGQNGSTKTDIYVLPRRMTVEEICKQVKLSIAELKKLNPGLVDMTATDSIDPKSVIFLSPKQANDKTDPNQDPTQRPNNKDPRSAGNKPDVNNNPNDPNDPNVAQGDDPDVKSLGKSGMYKMYNFLNKRYVVCTVDPHKQKVELFSPAFNDDVQNFRDVLAKKRNDLLFVMNGGMYEQDLSPVGLYIAEGKTYNEANTQKEGEGNFYQLRPNGIFLIDANGNPQVIPTDVYAKSAPKAMLATQSGPMLLVHGVNNSAFQPNSQNYNIRNGVGVNKKNEIVFVLSVDPVNFYEFSELFKEVLNCDNALYLDGVVSQIFAPELNKNPVQRAPIGVFVTVSKLPAKGDNQTSPPNKQQQEKGKPANSDNQTSSPNKQQQQEKGKSSNGNNK